MTGSSKSSDGSRRLRVARLLRLCGVKSKKRDDENASVDQLPPQDEQSQERAPQPQPTIAVAEPKDESNDPPQASNTDGTESAPRERRNLNALQHQTSLRSMSTSDKKPTTRKTGAKVRGSGAICPARGHAQFVNINEAEAQDLGRVAPETAQPRTLTKVPEGYRLEVTGVRVQLDATTTKTTTSIRPGKRQQSFSSLKVDSKLNNLQYRGVIGVRRQGKPASFLFYATDLPKRLNPDWTSLHVPWKDGTDLELVLQLQCRDKKDDDDVDDAEEDGGDWRSAFLPFRKQIVDDEQKESEMPHDDEVTLLPLTVFTVQNQDIVWHPVSVGGGMTVWFHVSLVQTTQALQQQHEVAEGAEKQVIAKKRQLREVHFQPKRRDAEQIAKDDAILAALLDEKTNEPKDVLTVVDRVFMKDIWNKSLAWIDMTGEFITEGLFMRCPDLLTILGSATSELMFDMLVGLIDRAVRNLNPETEVVARESYHRVPLQCAGHPDDFPFETLEDGFNQFASLGMRPHHWQEARSLFVLAMQKANPYLEDADAELLELGQDSCAYKFWNSQIMVPACRAIQEMDSVFESDANRELLRMTFATMGQDKTRSGIAFYETLFQTNPGVLPFFGTTEMNFLAGHLFDAVELLVETFNDFGSAMPVLNQLGRIHDALKIPVGAYPAIWDTIDATFRKVKIPYGDGTPKGEEAVRIWKALMSRAVLVTTRVSFLSERMLRKAFKWSEQVAHELQWDESYLAKRKFDIETEIRSTGTYRHTEEELIHGCRVAWRNSAKCVGRIAWNTMLVRDRRHVTDLDKMFVECLEHQRLATADGSLKAVMTVFKPRHPGARLGMRFWSQQLVRFACYEMADGRLMGDKANLDYTKECIEFGWTPPEPKTEFDVLPVVIEDTQSGVIKMFEVPKEYHKVTMIEHPSYPEFGKLKLRWCVVPTITAFTLSLGGIQYTACPFNGWFMETEITRDLLEPGRMDKMTAIARAIGVDPSDEGGFWREIVSLETNKAVMHSFRRDGHSIVDHVTAQAQFLAHDLREKREGRECPAQWSWVVPSSGGATMPIWHHEMRDFYIEPQYQYQVELFELRAFSTLPESDLLHNGEEDELGFERILILYASTTGTAEGYAYKAKKMLRPLRVDVRSCEREDPTELWKEFKANGGPYSSLLFITSTFGEGDPPANAVAFFDKLGRLPVSALKGVDFGVMAIGSRVYPDFCQAGILADKLFEKAGGNRFLPLRKADEVNDQAGTVQQWVGTVASHYDLEQKRALVNSGDVPEQDEEPHVVVEFMEDGHPEIKEILKQERTLADSAGSVRQDTGALARCMPENFSLCKVTRNSELIDFSTEEAKALFRSTRFLEFDLEGMSEDGKERHLTYETGDHACILPCNHFEVVLDLCNILKLEPTQWVCAKVQEGEAKPLTSPYMRVGDIFSIELDLSTQEVDGNLHLLEHLLSLARAQSRGNEPIEDIRQTELPKLEKLVESLSEPANQDGDDADGRLAREKAKKTAISAVTENFITIPELLREYPETSSYLTLADLIEFLPRLKPRYYSIASSSELHPSKLQLTVGVLTVNHKTSNKKRLGVCSNFLSRSTTPETPGELSSPSGAWNESSYVRMRVNTSSFRLPPKMTDPVIMVGPGTGISPMLGFLQAREKAKNDGVELGPCMVFFGCRAEQDFLHREQMRAWADKGVITSLQVAFSRLPDKPKEYVQHRLRTIQSEVWALLKENTCHYYVCGDSKMAEDVYDELLDCAKTLGVMDHVDAWDFFQKMKGERRFQTDTWGVVEKRSEVMDQHVQKNYNKAAAWLETVGKGNVQEEEGQA